MRLNSVFVIFLLLILSETRFSGGPTETVALTDSQRKEIEDLRAQLDKDFEEDEERTLKEHGIIIQPKWTTATKPKVNTNSKVIVTKTELTEAKALRDEISTAVRQDRYTPVVSSGHIGDNTKIIQELHKEYSANDNNKKSVKVSDTVSAKASRDGPNLIEATTMGDDPGIDIRKLQRLKLNKRRTREMLILESIEEDFTFDLGENVVEWEHIIHAGQEFFIGRLEKDLQIVHKNALRYEASEIVHIGSPITYLETYTFWNSDQQQQEGIIMVSTGNKVLWYRADEKLGQITLYWEWVVGSLISGLTHFTADGQHYLVVSTNQSSRAGYYALNIYQFDLKNKEFWIAQRLQLSHPCDEVTFLNTGRDFILAVPQNNTAVIYTFNPHTEASGHVRFQRKFSFESENIEYVTAFQMGGRSYLALGGMQPQILLYQQGEFVPKTIFGNNFGFVEFFFPIPVRTYRDDLILLVQHRVDFSTHKLTVLETLIWDGEAFEATIPAPCKLGSHTVYGVNCMLDIQRDSGIKGATLLRRGDEISVIVPRQKAESGLFRLHTKLLAKNSELKDLQEIFDFLKEWVAEQDHLIAEAQSFLNQPMDNDNLKTLNYDHIHLLKTPELFFTGNFKELYVNDYKWTNEDSAADLNHVINEIEKLEHEMSFTRHKRETVESVGHSASFENLDFDDVEAEFLEIESLNDEGFYIQKGVLDFDGILNAVELQVLESEHLMEGRQKMLEELSLKTNLEFERINGIPWRNLIDNLVFVNKPLELEKLEVEEITVEGEMEINQLNSLQFPEDYLWIDGVQNQIINAKKTFTGTLAANHVDTEGFINGKDPLDIVTLSDPQEWTGLPTFKHLEVSEILELNGTARGRGVEEFPQNPSLEDTKLINANCEFANLRVIGPILIEENYDNMTLDMLLSDIVQRPEDPNEEIHISAAKTFSNVEFPIDFHILDGMVNRIAINQFIPSQTDQELGLTTIDGYVYFGNLTLTGSYDGVMIKEFMRDTIKIDEPQNLTNTQLNFANVLIADTIYVVKTLNDVPIATGYQTVNEDLVIPKISFQTLHTNEANIPGDIKGLGKLNGLELDDSLEPSGNSSQSVNKIGNIFLNELVLEAGLQVDEIHGLKASFIYQFLDNVDSLPEMILDGKIHVDRVFITGDIQVNKLNGRDFDDDIQLTAIWLNRPNYLNTKLTFLETVDLIGDLNVYGDFNNQNLPDLIDDMVFRNPNGTVLILAPKKFARQVQVLGNTKIDALNGIPFNALANKRTPGIFKGSMQINGNLIVQELKLKRKLNDFMVSELTNQIRFDQQLQAFVLRGVTNFNNPLELEDLTVFGDLNEFKNLKGFFDNLVYKEGSCLLNGQYNFTGRVTIKDGVFINYLNGYDLLEAFKNIVFIDSREPIVIESPVNFTSNIEASLLEIQGDLQARNLSGCSVKKWVNDTLNLSRPEILERPLHFAPGSLNGNTIFAKYLNDIDLSKVITLHTPQNLGKNVQFSEIYLDGIINVTGPVNEVDLQMEFAKTLLTIGKQHIETPLTLHNVNVLQNLETKQPVNGDKDLKDVATLYEDSEFQSPFFFEELRVRNVFTEDLISGINFNDWYELTLWKEGRPQQRISGNWSVERLLLKNGSAIPELKLGTPHMDRTRYRLRELCLKLKELHGIFIKRSYALKHLRKAFELSLPNQERKVEINRAFEIKEYLLINLQCNSTVFKWNSTSKSYELMTSFESGYISQIAVATDTTTKDEFIKFMSNSSPRNSGNCSYTGLHLWKLKENKIQHLKNFEENVTELWAAGLNGHIFAITDGGVKQLSTTPPYEVKFLSINESFKTEEYSYIGKGRNSNILYTNGTHFAQVSEDPSIAKRLIRSMRKNFSYYSRSIHPLASVDESILKPNASLVQKLTFADFSSVIERILEDLDYRLGIEINITQLSIPESDLYDAHLVEDFVAIVEELRSQEIYPADTFDDIHLESIKIPENPGQVLAARTVQIVWPVIVEINEVHQYLRGNSTAEHPVCACILNNLGLMIKEVLELANKAPEIENNKDLFYTTTLSAVINRIRQFQRQLKALENELKLEISEDLTAEIENENEMTESENILVENLEQINDHTEQTILSTLQNPNYTLQIHKHPKAFVRERCELLNLEVGAEQAPYNLVAITIPKSQLTPGQPGGINLYNDLLENDLFQFIPAHKPRSLTTLRIRDITLLAYVEHCCTVNVLQYRGVEGFVDFAKFTSQFPIRHLIALSLPHMDYGQRFYFVMVLSHKLTFYETVFMGLKGVPDIDQIKCK